MEANIRKDTAANPKFVGMGSKLSTDKDITIKKSKLAVLKRESWEEGYKMGEQTGRDDKARETLMGNMLSSLHHVSALFDAYSRKGKHDPPIPSGVKIAEGHIQSAINAMREGGFR